MHPRLLAFGAITGSAALALAAQLDPFAVQTRDAHQKLVIAADPYISAERSKSAFGKKTPFEGGILAIDVHLRNDNDSPIQLNLDTVRLVVSRPSEDRQRLTPLSPEDAADRLVLEGHSNPRAPRRPFPFPGSGSQSSKGKAWDEMDGALRSVALVADVVPPHGTIKGFLYFDMNHEFEAIRYSHLYIPDLIFMTDKSPLLFFEIDFSSVSAN